MEYRASIGLGFRSKVRVLALAIAFFSMMGGVLANNDLVSLQDDPAQWVMPNKNYSGWNYSPLDQINTENVQDLTVAWTLALGIQDSHEAQPLVVGNMMYIVTPKPNYVYAVNLENGLIEWEFRPEIPELERAISVACCGAQTRGISYAEGKLFYNTLDGQLTALDAENGEVLWQTQIADMDIAETTTTNPLVVNDSLIVGVAGGEFGVRGWVASYDMNTGEENWRYFNMGPNDEMGIGPRFQPFFADDQVENPGLDTWYADSWQHGGGTVWGWWTYDTELNMFYYSTGNCGPWNPDYRRDPETAPGLDVYTNKYCASLMARDADTGELIWATSLTPQDQWDLDEVSQNFLIDIEIDGEERKALVKAARNGFFYVFDRATGELLHEPETHTFINYATGFDMEAGRPIYNPEKIMYTDVPVENICPTIATTNVEAQAYSPDTGLVYFSNRNQCRGLMMVQGGYVPGESYRLREYVGQREPGPGGHRGELQAWDPATNQRVWNLASESVENRKAVTVTGGNLVFQGTDEGFFRAVDATNGEVLWTFRTGTDFRNAPISYLGPDGNQYVVVIASRAPSDPVVTADAPPDADARYRRSGTMLYAFSLRTSTAEGGGN